LPELDAAIGVSAEVWTGVGPVLAPELPPPPPQAPRTKAEAIARKKV
jgi:hypothetical protein